MNKLKKDRSFNITTAAATATATTTIIIIKNHHAQWGIGKKQDLSIAPGARFLKDPITYRALKAIFNDLYLKKKAVHGH